MSGEPDRQEKLAAFIKLCKGIDFSSVSTFLFAWQAPENALVHFMPRLSLLFEGSETFFFFENGKICTQVLEAPAIYHCTREGYLWGKEETQMLPRNSISFCYLPEIIRISWVDTVNHPDLSQPDWDVHFNSSAPLSAGGIALLNAFETLQKQGNTVLARRLLGELWDLTLQELEAGEALASIHPPRIWNEINFYLRNHRTGDVSRKRIAKEFHISSGYLSRLIRRYAGCTFTELTAKYRLEHGAMLLKGSRLSIDEIADQCGFSYRSYFDRLFKAYYHMTPKKYRENG